MGFLKGKVNPRKTLEVVRVIGWVGSQIIGWVFLLGSFNYR